VELGWIAGAFGIAGEVRLGLHHPGGDALAKPREVTLVAPDGARRAARLSCRPGPGGRFTARIQGVTDRESARALFEHRVVIPRASLPEPEAGAFYVADLVGTVALIGDERFGVIAAVHQAGPVDLFEIDRGAGEPVFVAMIEANVAGIDVAQRIVRLTDAARDAAG
jgi:16S rRNA processing protein RimM